MKRFIAAAVIFVFAVFSLASCSDKGTKTNLGTSVNGGISGSSASSYGSSAAPGDMTGSGRASDSGDAETGEISSGHAQDGVIPDDTDNSGGAAQSAAEGAKSAVNSMMG
ncbi:MAG: hypothetical protein IKS19_02375 [Clostridia bacterium]|nr:hypothetical protein [Clostridia bacterium]